MNFCEALYIDDYLTLTALIINVAWKLAITEKQKKIWQPTGIFCMQSHQGGQQQKLQ